MLRGVLFAVPVAVANCGTCDGPSYDTLDDVTFTIDEGKHDSDPGGIRKTELLTDLDRWVTFEARFRADTAYLSADPVNQYDWNKLMGLTVTDIHEDSIRLRRLQPRDRRPRRLEYPQ